MSANESTHEHESMIKTPTQLAVVMVLSFVIPVIGILLLVQLVLGGINTDPKANSPEAVVERIKPVAQVTISAGGAGGAAKTGEVVYNTVCMACHATGAANAPKTGDAAAWRKLIAEGQKAIVADGIKGVRAMPPKGGAPDLSDYEFERAVVYMANKSGGNFKEPPPPKPAAKAAK
ncbi:MAG: c-type cytochrome [Burkholderiales bacterium]